LVTGGKKRRSLTCRRRPKIRDIPFKKRREASIEISRSNLKRGRRTTRISCWEHRVLIYSTKPKRLWKKKKENQMPKPTPLRRAKAKGGTEGRDLERKKGVSWGGKKKADHVGPTRDKKKRKKIELLYYLLRAGTKKKGEKDLRLREKFPGRFLQFHTKQRPTAGKWPFFTFTRPPYRK